MLTACSLGKAETQTASEETAKNPNVLIVYYSDSDIMGHAAEAIATKIPNANSYKTVFLCYPLWLAYHKIDTIHLPCVNGCISQIYI